MNKQQIQQRVLQNGEPLPLDKFEWDENTKTFSTEKGNLVLDFKGISNVTFKTGSSCTFKTDSSCTFNTGSSCTFDIGEECVVIRRDVYEVIEIPQGQKIKLNKNSVKGYTCSIGGYTISADPDEEEEYKITN